MNNHFISSGKVECKRLLEQIVFYSVCFLSTATSLFNCAARYSTHRYNSADELYTQTNVECLMTIILSACLFLSPSRSFLVLFLPHSCFLEKRRTWASPGHTDQRWLTWCRPHRGGHGLCVCGGVGCFSHCLPASSCSSAGGWEAGPRSRGWHRDPF